MLKKSFVIFMRDLKVSTREFISLYILVVPLLLAIGINLLTPSINDTTVNLAVIEGENPTQVEFFEKFAKVELFKDEDAVIKRVQSRDNIIGILPENDNYYVLKQGNEPENVVDYGKVIIVYYEEGLSIEKTSATIHDFGRTVPPLKKMLVNITIMMLSVLGGMLIAINIVEEKVDKTIRAIHLTPISRLGYIFGKSILGLVLPIYGTIALLFITGFGYVNIGQMIVFVLVSSVIALLIGFVEGLQNDDVINAAANIKILFLPIAAVIAASELLADKWQKFFYWIPFYWTYKGVDSILADVSTWSQILLYSVIVLVLSGIVFVRVRPKIKKGLE